MIGQESANRDIKKLLGNPKISFILGKPPSLNQSPDPL